MRFFKNKCAFFLVALSPILIGCSSDDDEINGDSFDVNYDSKLRIESGMITGDFDGYTTFTQSVLDFGDEQVHEFSFNFQDHLVLTESTILLGINMYSDDEIFSGLTEGSSYYFDDLWLAGGAKNTFGVGLTIWDENHENGIIYTHVLEGNIVFSEIGNDKIRALFNFKIESPETGDVIQTKTSLLIAYPQD
ncbi:MAG: hypothetical protein LAT51_04480 [Flavobacteriaceae bacterium]|nr:hypothetical protein [Flavobacteriaceae bacterium]